MIVLVFPFQGELECFLGGAAPPGKKVRGLRVITTPSDPDWILAVCGQGKVEAALACQILADTYSPRAFFLLGSAAALDPTLKAGDAVLSDPCLEWDFRPDHGKDSVSPPRFNPGKPFPHACDPKGSGDPKGNGVDGSWLRAGTVLSADRDVFDPGEKRRLREEFGALATAWEGAGFHRFLRRSGLPGWEIRIITETAEEGRISLADMRLRMLAAFPGLRKSIRAALRPEQAQPVPG